MKNESKVFFVNCNIQNEQVIDDSQFLNVSNSSHAQAIETNFSNCHNHGIETSTSSFLNISHCTFSGFNKRLLYSQINSKVLIHNCAFKNSNNNNFLIHFHKSKYDCYDCTFTGIYNFSLRIVNFSELLMERSDFINCISDPIVVNDNSFVRAFDCKIINLVGDGIYGDNKSKMNIQEVTFENCRFGIYSCKNTVIDATKCQFLKIKEYPIYCTDSSIVTLNACLIVDPGISFFYALSGAFVKINSSDLRQSNSSKQFSKIETNGKFSMIMGSIEWKGVLDYSKEFQNASLAQLQNVKMNQISLNHFKE
jgi:hypothetical protein